MRNLFFVSAILICALNLGEQRAGAEGPDLSDGPKVAAGASWGLGNMSNSNFTIASRAMNTISLFAMPSYMWRQFFAGLDADLRFVGQNTATADVGGTNIKGTGYMIGLVVGYMWPQFYALTGLDFLGKHAESIATVTGLNSRYNKPIGVRLGFGYFFTKMISADFTATIDSYRQNLFGDQSIDISDTKLTHRNFALGASVHF